MGEGHYRLIGVGCLNPQTHFAAHQDVGEALDSFRWALEKRGIELQTACEAEPDYLCIVVALDNPNARTRGERLARFSYQHIPDLLRAAVTANPHLDMPALLTEYEQRPVLGQQIRELSKRIMAHWCNREFAEQDRLEQEQVALYRKTCNWSRFSGILPALPPSVAEAIPAEAISKACQAWETVRRIAADDFGVELPTCDLIFADDWD